MPPLLGGLKITRAGWLGPATLRVRFSSAWGSLYTQLYAGRTLAGVTETRAARVITARVHPSVHPQHLQLLAVTDPESDHGEKLPPRPYNRVRLSAPTTSWPADSDTLVLTSGLAPGGAVDASNVIATELFDTDRTYQIETPPLENGTWNFELAGVDRLGNVGPAVAAQHAVLAHPPDVDKVNGERLDVAINAGSVTLSAEFS